MTVKIVFLLLPVVAPVFALVTLKPTRKDAQGWPMGHAVREGVSEFYMSTMPCMLPHSKQERVI